MTTDKFTPSADLNALAAEALDLWQEHLATYANDPQAKAELMKLMEPQRRLFADWAEMMQHSLHGTDASPQGPTETGARTAAVGPAPASSASDDSALCMAQFAHRTAQLEKHVAELEQRLVCLETGKSESVKNRPTGKTVRPAQRVRR